MVTDDIINKVSRAIPEEFWDVMIWQTSPNHTAFGELDIADRRRIIEGVLEKFYEKHPGLVTVVNQPENGMPPAEISEHHLNGYVYRNSDRVVNTIYCACGATFYDASSEDKAALEWYRHVLEEYRRPWNG